MTEVQSNSTPASVTFGDRFKNLIESPMGSAYLATACTGIAICVVLTGMGLVNLALS